MQSKILAVVRPRKIIVLVWSVLAAVAGGSQALAQDTRACENASSSAVSDMGAHSEVATAQQPAEVLPKAGPNLVSGSPALRLTLRPTAADPNSPFLVAVFATYTCENKGNELGELLGTVSFFPLNVGQSQEFVLPAPQQGFPSVLPQHVQLTVRLIPANPARLLGNASVEVLSAQFAE
jgi:hypothetical protein